MSSGYLTIPTSGRYFNYTRGLSHLSTGEIYALAKTGNGSHGYMYELVNDTTFSLRASWESSTVNGVSLDQYYLATVVDPSDNILVIVKHGTASGVSAPVFSSRWFDPGTDSWLGSWVSGPVCTADYAPMNYMPDVTIDSSGTAHVFYAQHEKFHGGAQRHLYHTEWSGSAWGTEEQVDDQPGGDWYGNSAAAEAVLGDDLEVMYTLENVGLADDIVIRRKNGTWGTQTTYTQAMDNGARATLPLIADTSDNVYRYALDESENIFENDSDTGLNIYPNITLAYIFSAAIYNGTRYLFYQNSSGNIVVSENSGAGWSTTTLISGTGNSVYCVPTTEWQYNDDGRVSPRIYYLYRYPDGGQNNGIGWYEVTLPGGPTPVPDLVSRTRYNRNVNLRR